MVDHFSGGTPTVLGNGRLRGQAFHHLSEDAFVAPPLPSVTERLRRAILLGRVTPPQAIATDRDNSPQDWTIIDLRLPCLLGKQGCSRAVCVFVCKKRLLICQSPCGARISLKVQDQWVPTLAKETAKWSPKLVRQRVPGLVLKWRKRGTLDRPGTPSKRPASTQARFF